MGRRQPAPGPATVYDDVLTWQVPSRRNPAQQYRVEVDAYHGSGWCACPDFGRRFEKILLAGISAQEAWERKLVQWRPYQRTPEDLLRCAHICGARDMLATHVIRAFDRANQKQK